MEVNRKTRMQFRIQNLVFLVLFLTVIGLLAWLSQRYNFESDWTASGRNTLSQASITLLQRIPAPVTITAFARESNLIPTRRNIEDLIQRYQKHKADIKLTFINPDTEPDKTREMGITVDGELVISYQGRSEHVTILKEETVTNALQRLLRSGEKKVLFLSGHGERDPEGQANHDYGLLSQHLAAKGIKTATLNLNDQPSIPEDTAVLVIAGPRLDYLDGEVELIRNYLKHGGNLLWLHEPGKLYNLEKLAEDLQIRFLPGVIVDPTTQMLGISDPSFALVTRYGNHPITRDFSFMTLFPRASGITFDKKAKETPHAWQAEPILQTVERSWSETGPLQGLIEFQQGADVPGPLTLGMALSRDKPVAEPEAGKDSTQEEEQPAKTQRVVILGDGDFLTNAYLGNQGNQDLGFNIFNWLSHDDNFIAIPVTTAPDTELHLSETTWSVLGLFYLFGMPLLLLASGVTIWLKRRKR